MRRFVRRNIIRGGIRTFLKWIAVGSVLLLLLHTLNQKFFNHVEVKDVEHVENAKRIENKVLDASGQEVKSSDSSCGITCPSGQKSFYVKTGTERSVGPTICYDGKVIVSSEKENTGRGINAVFINEDGKAKETKSFDTYDSEQGFLRYVQNEVPDRTAVIMASYDDMINSDACPTFTIPLAGCTLCNPAKMVTDEGKQWMKMLGSTLIDNVAFRDSYFLVGQKGLQQNYAIEFHSPKTEGEQYASAIEKKGCFSLPLGPLEKTATLLLKVKEIKPGSLLKNCGLGSKCEGAPIKIFTGDADRVSPYICVGDHMIMEKGVNDAGRGFNFIVLDETSKSPKQVARFDTYAKVNIPLEAFTKSVGCKDSTKLEAFIKQLSTGDIVIGVINDDASMKLSKGAVELLNGLGSSMIQNLRFRDIWFFVGQKGMNGYTTLEEMSFAMFDGDWPRPIQKIFCLPKKLEVSKVPPRSSVSRNMPRREFCKQYDGYTEFCDPSTVDEKLKLTPLMDKTYEKSEVYTTPILVIPGMDHNAFARTLETLFAQPGLHPEVVMVALDDNFPDHAALANLYGFGNVTLESKTKYEDQMNDATEQAFERTKNKYLIIIEEELVLTIDFLSFMAECLPTVEKDDSLYGISAFNYNGYDITSGDRHLVYRVEDFPGLAFLLKRSVYTTYMKNSMHKCCNSRSWDSWHLGPESFGEMLIPDVSRVFRLPYQSANDADSYLEELFYRPRLTNMDGYFKIKNLDILMKDKYEAEMERIIKDSTPMPVKELMKCGSKGKVINPPETAENVVLYYSEKDDNEKTLHKLCQCFGLYSSPGKPLKGRHKGAIRFFHKKKNFYFIGSSSPYFKLKATSVEAYTVKT